MPAPQALEIGARLGPYEVLDVLGRGSQGVVYLARRSGPAPWVAVPAGGEAEGGEGSAPAAAPEPVEVALKVLRPDADEGARARFLREAQTMARIRHDGIVRVLESGSAHGLPYYAMERIEGVTLERRILSLGPLEPEGAARLVATLARTVEYGHEKGIIHRDLKPSNVLLPGGSLAAPKISDFGLALVAGGTRLTQTNALVGTPCYLAPEVVRGGKASEASDVYALGAILYECLTGKAPFEGTSIGAILHQVVTRQPTPLRGCGISAPGALERVCLHCLEKTPGHRPPSAGAVARALERTFGERERLGMAREARERLALAGAGIRRSWTLAVGLLLGLELGFLLGLYLTVVRS